MKNILALILVGLMFQSCGLLKNRKLTKISIEHQIDYCSGEPPTEEMLEIITSPQTAKNAVYYIHQKKDRSDNEIVVALNDKGMAQIPKLSPGVYYVFPKAKNSVKEMNDETTPEEACRYTEMMMYIYKFEVTKKTKRIDLTLHIPCSPCQDAMP
jgi:hypothetical protein